MIWIVSYGAYVMFGVASVMVSLADLVNSVNILDSQLFHCKISALDKMLTEFLYSS